MAAHCDVTPPQPSAVPEVTIETLMARVKSMMSKITADPEDPSPVLLNALAAILETQESRYLEETEDSDISRRSHNVGRITKVIRDNYNLYELISSKFLNDIRYPISVVAATARLLLNLVFSCLATWVSSLGFQDYILANFRRWAENETPMKSLDEEILQAYSIGLLALCLNRERHLVESVLASELPAKLIRYLRKEVLGDSETSQGKANSSNDHLKKCNIGSTDITDWIKESIRATEAESRAANAPEAVVRAAGEAAAKVVMDVASEEYKRTKNEGAAVLAASGAASDVRFAAEAFALSRIFNNVHGDSESSMARVTGVDDYYIGKFFILSSDSVAILREKFCIQCLVVLEERVKGNRPLLYADGLDICLALLKKYKTSCVLPDILRLVSALANRQKFATSFVGRGGIQRLLAITRDSQTSSGVAHCLHKIGLVHGIVERMCSLPPNTIDEVVALAIQLLECKDASARKDACSFLGHVFVSSAFINSFDSHDGLRRLLSHLHNAVQPSPANDSDSSFLFSPKASTIAKAYDACFALRRYMRAHLLLLVDSIRPSKRFFHAPMNISNAREAYKPLDLSDEALAAVSYQIHKDWELGSAFIRARWPVVDEFLNSNGHVTMFELCRQDDQESEEYSLSHDLLPYILDVLHIVTLVPYSRNHIVNTVLSNGQVSIDFIRSAINTPVPVEPLIVEPALSLLVNLVCPPSSIRDKQNDVLGELEQGFRQARQAVCANNGILGLLKLLQPRTVKANAHLCVLTCRVLIGLARDNTIANLLSKLQIGRKVLELARDSPRSTSDCERNKWQAELDKVTVELIHVITNPGCASSSVAGDASTTNFRSIEKAAIAASSPITYDRRELLQLIYEHLQAQGLEEAASVLVKESKLTPVRDPIQAWPSGRTPSGFSPNKPQSSRRQKSSHSVFSASKNKVLPMKRKSEDGLLSNPEHSERLTLDSLVREYLKQQHHQCANPITTVPTFSLLYPHVCSEPRQSLNAPSNMTATLFSRAVKGAYGKSNNRRFIYSRFRLKRTFHDDTKPVLNCIAFLGDLSVAAFGGQSRRMRVFNHRRDQALESPVSHSICPTSLQSCFVGETQLLLSSSERDVCLWNGSTVLNGPRYVFGGIRAGQFSSDGTQFGALPLGAPRLEVLLYDIETLQMAMTLKDETNINSHRGGVFSQIHFSQIDSTMLLFDGDLWDYRSSDLVHRFPKYTDYGGGGFHPSRNEVIINSEVYDLRNFKLLYSVPALKQTAITFNAAGDIIYAVLRRNHEHIGSAFTHPRNKHRLYSSFVTVDATNYSTIATVPVARGVLDLATEPSDSFVAVTVMDRKEGKWSSARVYEIGKTKVNDDGDSDLVAECDVVTENDGRGGRRSRTRRSRITMSAEFDHMAHMAHRSDDDDDFLGSDFGDDDLLSLL